MNEPKISVIVPAYNAEETLSATLSSLLASDIPDSEIIIVDDGSRDGTSEICDRFAEKYDNIICIHKKNGGVSSARNAGLDVARGEWIGFIDSDDTVEPDAYSYLIKEAELAGAKIAQCAVYLDYEDKSEILFSPEKPIKAVMSDKHFTKTFMKYVSYGSWCKIFKRSAIGDTRFDEETVIGEDFRFNLDVLVKSGEILICPEPKYHYLQRATSVIHTVNPQRLSAFRTMIKRAELDFKNCTALKPIISTAILLDASDTASKLVLSGIENAALFEELRKDIKSRTFRVIFASGITLGQRLKLLLIAYFPGLYRSLLIKYKGKRGKD